MNLLDLPVEVLLRIFRFLGPCEIIQLRQVCKQFQEITHDPVLWREMYTEARLPRPPGPLPWQSTRYLERALATSEVLSRTWTSRPLIALSRTPTLWGRRSDGIWTALFGRWCLHLEGKTIQCRDLDSGTHKVLYNGVDHADFWFTAAAATDVGGQRIFVLLADFMLPHEFVKLLDFRVEAKGLSEPQITDLSHIGRDSLNVWKLTKLHNHSYATTTFLSLHADQPYLVYEFSTRNLFRLPVLNHSNELLPPDPRLVVTQLVLTKTHIIAIRDILSNHPSVIQAFTVPDSTCPRDSHGIADLRLTHQAVFHTRPQLLTLLRNSRVDPITKSINIRLLSDEIRVMGSRRRLSYIDLTLPDASSTSILPIEVHEGRLFESMWHLQRYTASDDGHARGILLSSGAPLGPSTLCKFTIDASGDGCEAKFGAPSSISGAIDCVTDDVAFDGFTGRIHYFCGRPGACPEVVTVQIG